MRISYATFSNSDSTMHYVNWNNGVVEPGSSGSPLINTSGQVIGQL